MLATKQRTNITPNKKTAPVARKTTAELKNTSSIWHGLSHKWENHPHRMSDFANYIKDKSVEDDASGKTLTSTVNGGFKPGQDGDTGNIKVFYEPVHHPDIGVKRGYWVEKFTDNPDLGRKDDRSVFTSTEFRSINLDTADLNHGNFDNYSVVLRGFDIDMTNTSTGKTGYVWPTEFEIKILSASISSDRSKLDCNIRIKLSREDSPDVLKKSVKDRIEYNLKVFFTVIGGNSAAFQESSKIDFSAFNNDFEGGATFRNKKTQCHPSVTKSVTGITGLSFSIASDKDKDGRYIQYYEMYIEDEPIDAKGEKEINARLGIHTKKSATIFNANYSATINTVQLQFKGDQARGLTLTKNAGLTVCTGGGVTIFHTCDSEKSSDSKEVSHKL
jgi:hypothetical protein